VSSVEKKTGTTRWTIGPPLEGGAELVRRPTKDRVKFIWYWSNIRILDELS